MSKSALKDSTEKSIVVIFFLLYAIWMFFPALELGVTVSSTQGDGIGTIAWMSDVATKTHMEGISYFLSDLTSFDDTGLGVYPAGPINSIQKVIIYIISFFVESDNIYDVYALCGFFLVGVTSFFLFKELGVNSMLSFFGAFLLLNNDNFYSRISGHLTLAIPFAPILLTLFLIKMSKVATLRNMLWVALIMAFNFSMNEYNGYYGVFFSIALFIGLYFYYHSWDEVMSIVHLRLLLRSVFIASLVFILLMSLFYPNLIGMKIINLFISSDTTVVNNTGLRGYQDFLSYSIKNHSYIFSSENSLLLNSFSTSILTNNTFSEQSFRIGPLIPVFLILYVFITSFIKDKVIERDKKTWFALFLFPAIFLIYLLSNDPRYGLSLVDFTYNISGIFRVSSRAYLYITIMIIAVYVFYLGMLYNRTYKFSHGRVFSRLALLLLLCLSLNDAIQMNLWTQQVKVNVLPDADFYQELSSRDEGRVIELPFYHFPEDPYEKGYPLNYFRSLYKFELVNAILPRNNASYNGYTALYELLKEPSIEAVAFLREIGVKYIVVNSAATSWVNGIDGLTLLNQDEDRILFNLEGTVPINKKAALKKINELALVTVVDGDEIFFNNASSRALLRNGFTSTEGWGVWTEKKQAVINFRHDTSGNSFVKIKYRVFGDEKYVQKIIFHIDDKVIMSVTNTQAGVHEVTLPIPSGRENMVEIKLEIPTAISPSSLYTNNQDYRTLGIGLINMKYFEEQIK